MTRPALADYLLLFRAPGDNATPIKAECTNEEWIKWASPVWLDIRETNTLNTAVAKDDKDERHICPLQLDLIDRVVRLWSNRGEVVLSPFAGIGSEGFVSVKWGRRFVGCELKPMYWRIGCKNLTRAEADANAPMLFPVDFDAADS
jgi:DNA modification methylase